MDIQTEILSIRERNSLTTTSQEIRSGKLFALAAERILEQAGHFSDPTSSEVGIELESIGTDEIGNPIGAKQRDRMMRVANNLVLQYNSGFSLQPELGAAQIEINQASEAFFQLDYIEIEKVVGLFNQIDSILLEAGEKCGSKFLNLGFHPFADVVNVPRTDKPKYEIVPTHHDGNRSASSRTLQSELNLTKEPDATVAALTNSLQFNISMPDVSTAMRAMNLLFQMTPNMLALGGNAMIAQSEDTRWSDFRNHIWDKTHRTSAGQRVFLPEDFIHSPEDLFLRMARFPLILEPTKAKSALEIATGTNWLAAKLKFLCDEDLNINKLLLEFRPLSVQQTPEENAAIFLLSLGRLKFGMETNEPLLSDFDTIRVNGELAGRRGSLANLVTNKWDGSNWRTEIVNGAELRELEIHHSSLGLSMNNEGVVPVSKYDLFKRFFERNIQVQNPSDRLRADLGTTWELGSQKERAEHIRDVLINSHILR